MADGLLRLRQWKLAAGIVVAQLVLAIFAMSPLHAGEDGAKTVTVTVVSTGWHTGLALPISLAGQLQAAQDFPNAQWLEIGFGDEAFYRDPDPGFGTVLRAALLDTPAALHVFAMSRPPEQTFLEAELLPLSLTGAEADRLIAFIAGAFARDREGRRLELGPGLYPDSRFYRANDSFTLSHTCNTWAARALVAAGLSLSANGVTTAEDFLGRLRDTGNALGAERMRD